MIYKNPKSFIKKYIDRFKSYSPDHRKLNYSITKDSKTQELSTLERLESDYFLHYVKRNFKKKYLSIKTHQSNLPLESNQKFLRKLDPIQSSYEEFPNKLHSKVIKILPESKKISLNQKFSSLSSANFPEDGLKQSTKIKEAFFKRNQFEFQEDLIKTPISRSRIRIKKYPKTVSSSIQDPEVKTSKFFSCKNIQNLKIRQFSSKSKQFARISPSKRLSRLLHSFSLERLKTFKDFHLIKLFNY